MNPLASCPILPPRKYPPFERFAFLDALRGLGALGVTCYHIHRYRPLRAPVDSLLPGFVQNALLYGWVGVPVFFVIAGFVVAYSLRNTPVTLASFGNFTLRRIVRLGLPYWTTILLVVALDYVARQWWRVPSVTDPVGWPKLAANFAFLQDVLGYGNISAGTWFVCIDLQFGLLFVVLLWLVQRLSCGCPDGGKAQAVVLTAVFVPLGLLSLFLFNLDARYDMWIIYFFCMPTLGTLAWWALENRLLRGVFWAYAVALVVGLAYHWRLEIAIALGAGVTIYVVGRLGHLGDWLTARWLQYLGRISYSLYLIHYAAGWAVVTVGHSFTGDDPGFAVGWLAAALVASIGAAHLLYVFVEAPSVRLAARLKTW